MKFKILRLLSTQALLYGVLVLFILPSSLLAQTITVKGNVTDADNAATLPGVNIVVSGTTSGVVTDSEGNYSIQVPSSQSVLVFSFIGYTPQEITVGNQAVINVVMIPDVKSLQEVVVIGYGVQKKANLTGSVSTVTSELLDARPLTSAASALQGTASGVFVNQDSGQPGRDNVSVNIRGVGTLNNANALILVDGIEAPMNNINPDDIESMTVLKDAASAAIYGSRAANGVILITTKRGKNAKGVAFNYNGYYGISEAVRLPKMVTNGTTFAELWNEAKLNFGPTPKYDAAQMADIAAHNYNTDWYGELFSTAPIQQHNLSAAGSTDKTNFRFSIGILDQDGVVPKAEYKRYNTRLNLDTKVNKRLTLGTSISLTRGDRGSSQENLTADGDAGILAGAARSLPLDPIRNSEDGILISPRYSPGHVFMNLARSDYNVLTNDILANVYVELEIVKGLKIKGTQAINYRDAHHDQFNHTIEFYNMDTGPIVSDAATSRYRYRKTLKSESLTTWLTATYERTFGDHYTSVLAGFNQETYDYDEFTASRSNFVSNSIPILDLGLSNRNNSESNTTAWALQSYFGRVNYNFKNRYLFEANVRADGSSRFKNDKWGVFPSFSAGWIISDESFFQGTGFFDLLKIRASWGQLGNQNIGDFRYAKRLDLAQNYSFGGTPAPGAAQITPGNPDLVWETTTTTDIGINIGLLESRISIEADYFNRKATDILYDVPTSIFTGYATNIENSASVVNKGWELAIGYKDDLGPVRLEVSGNVTHVKSEVLKLTEGVNIKYLGTKAIEVGSPVNSYYGYEANGIFNIQEEYDAAPTHTGIQPQYGVGDVQLVDKDGNGVINTDDRKVIGKSDPTWIFGFNLALKFKGFDLSALFQGAQDFQSYAEAEIAQPFFNSAQLQSRWLDRWTPENQNASMPRLYEGTGPSTATVNSFWLLDRSYLRFKNLQIGYAIPNAILGKTGIKSLRIYVNGQNLFVRTKFPYFDPERPSDANRGANGFPNLRIISGGLNINF